MGFVDITTIKTHRFIYKTIYLLSYNTNRKDYQIGMFFNILIFHKCFRRQQSISLAVVIPMLFVLLSAQKVSSIGTYDGASCSPVNGTLPNLKTSAATLPAANADSLLIVVVNHSACAQEADATNYSASVTDVLSDLWPGPMVVFMMQGNSVTQIGPRPPSVRDDLKAQVNNIPFSGNVPLEQGMQAAQNFFQQNGSPQGSRVVVLTPTSGMTTNAQVLSQSVAAFAQEKIAVYTYGMAGVDSDQGTISLLQQIADATGGDYQSISDASTMSQAVMHFCELNCGDSFIPIAFNPAHHDYIIPLQDASQSLNLLTFYDTGTGRNVFGYAGRPIRASSSLTNNHYEFDTVSGLQEKCPCDITLDTGDDTHVLVYEFKTGQSTRQLQPPSQQPHPSLPRLTWPIIGIIGLVVLLMALILWLLFYQPEMGYLVRERMRIEGNRPKSGEDDELKLGKSRPILKRMFSKWRIATKELEQHHQVRIIGGLVNEPLIFVATRNGILLCLEPGRDSSVSVKKTGGRETSFSDKVRAIHLETGDIILRGGRPVVTFRL